MIELRGYQHDAVQGVRDLAGRNCRRVVLQLDTGAGKTLVACEVIRLASAKGKRVVFFAHRRELIRQASRQLGGYGVRHGIVMAGEAETPAPVQIISKDTLISRVLNRQTMELPPADLVIADEAHLSTSAGWLRLFARYPHAFRLGLTATPVLEDGRSLGDYYDGLYQSISTSELIAAGYLVPCQVWAPSCPNLTGVPKSGFDWSEPHLGEVMNHPGLVGDVVKTWQEYGQNRPTVVFASGVAHSIHLAARFNEAGVRCAHLDQSTPMKERDQVLVDLACGDVQVVCNCGILPEGVDVPPVGCVVLARPTRRFRLYKQMIGRSRRPWTYEDGTRKEYAIVLDHAGAVFLHGLPDVDVDWQLKPGKRVQDVLEQRRQEGKDPKPILCPNCAYVFSGASKCPNCGQQLRTVGRDVEHTDGKLVPVDQGKLQQMLDPKTRERYWLRCLGVAANTGKTCGMAAAMYKQRFGNFPEDWLPHRPKANEWQQPAAVLFPQFTPGGRRR